MDLVKIISQVEMAGDVVIAAVTISQQTKPDLRLAWGIDDFIRYVPYFFLGAGN